MVEEKTERKVLKMVLKKPWRFFRPDEKEGVAIKIGPGEFEVIKVGQRLVFKEHPDRGMEEAYARLWAGEHCGENQIIIIDPEEEKAKKMAEEKRRKKAEEKF